MAKLSLAGLKNYARFLNQLIEYRTTEDIIGKALHAGAGIMADAIRDEIEDLPLIRGNNFGTPENKVKGITLRQKEGLEEGFGISPVRFRGGYFDVKLGFDGYNDAGQPNALIARSVNSGTSFREKNPFVDRAVKATHSKAVSAMQKTADEEIEKIAKGT